MTLSVLLAVVGLVCSSVKVFVGVLPAAIVCEASKRVWIQAISQLSEGLQESILLIASEPGSARPSVSMTTCWKSPKGLLLASSRTVT